MFFRHWLPGTIPFRCRRDRLHDAFPLHRLYKRFVTGIFLFKFRIFVDEFMWARDIIITISARANTFEAYPRLCIGEKLRSSRRSPSQRI